MFETIELLRLSCSVTVEVCGPPPCGAALTVTELEGELNANAADAVPVSETIELYTKVPAAPVVRVMLLLPPGDWMITFAPCCDPEVMLNSSTWNGPTPPDTPNVNVSAWPAVSDELLALMVAVGCW